MEVDGEDQPIRNHAWGLDLSGRSGGKQGAGGVGGLCFETEHATNVTYHASFDSNGNLTSLRNPVGGTGARYEYGPFGESLTARDALAGTNPFRFSTKYTDAETGLVYYGYRYYNASLGRWLSRDPIGETDGPSLYAIVGNTATAGVDALGLKKYVMLVSGAGEQSALPLSDNILQQAIEQVALNAVDGDHTRYKLVSLTKPYSELRRWFDELKTQDEQCKYPTVALIGFSYGGHAVNNAAWSAGLFDRNMLIDLVITIDPVGNLGQRSTSRNRNVSRHVSGYQRVDGLPSFWGMSASGADINKQYNESAFKQFVEPISKGSTQTETPLQAARARAHVKMPEIMLETVDKELKSLSEVRNEWNWNR